MVRFLLTVRLIIAVVTRVNDLHHGQLRDIVKNPHDFVVSMPYRPSGGPELTVLTVEEEDAEDETFVGPSTSPRPDISLFRALPPGRMINHPKSPTPLHSKP